MSSDLKMYMKVLLYIISRIRNLILALKGQIIHLLSIIMCFDNVTNKQSAPGIAIHRKERSFRGRKVPSAEGRFLYGRKLLNKFISKIIL